MTPPHHLTTSPPHHPATIAIDCRTALSPKTGDRTYTLTLLRGLARLELDPARWKFFLLLDAPDVDGVLPQSPCFESVVLSAPNSRLWTLAALPKWARAARPDLVHVHYLAPWGLPCPFVTTIHDVVWRAMPETFPKNHRAVMNLGMPSTARRAAKIITVSEFSRGEIAQHLRVSPEKISVTYNAVDERYLQPVTAGEIGAVREKYKIGPAPYVLSVGVQQPRKNVPRLIEAFLKLKEIHPDWTHRLVIAGKPGWGEDSAFRITHSALALVGYVADADLPAHYAGAACFAYPSLYEGFGLPIVEGMACGAPVLTSDCGATKEVAGNAAQLCDPRSTESITAALEKVLGNETRAAQLRELGKVRAAEFTVEKLAEGTLGVYRSLLAV